MWLWEGARKGAQIFRHVAWFQRLEAQRALEQPRTIKRGSGGHRVVGLHAGIMTRGIPGMMA